MAPGMIADGLMESFRTTGATLGAFAAVRVPAGIAIAAARIRETYGRNVTGE